MWLLSFKGHLHVECQITRLPWEIASEHTQSLDTGPADMNSLFETVAIQ